MPILGLFRSSKPSDGRRKRSPDRQPWHQHARSIAGWPLIVAAGFWALATLIMISGDEPFGYSTEMVLKRPILSRVNFERVNEFRTETARRKVQQAVPNYFRLDGQLVDAIQAEFRDLHAAVKASENFETFKTTHEAKWPLDEAAFGVFKSLTDPAGSEQFKGSVDTLANRLADEPMCEQAEVEREVRSTASHVMLDRGDGRFQATPKERLIYAKEPVQVEALSERIVRFLFAAEIRPVLEGIIRKAIAPASGAHHPICVFDETLTKSKIDEAGAIDPVTDEYEAGDRLINTGPINNEALALLKIEHEEYLKQRNSDPQLRVEWRKKQAGLMGVVLLVTIGLVIFTCRTQPRIARRTPRTIGIAGLLLAMLIVDRFILLQIDDSPMWSVMTLTMTAAILTIAYSQLFALGVTMALSLLSVLALGAPFSLLIVLFSVSAVTILLLREVRSRMKMLQVGVIAALAASVGALLVGLADGRGADWLGTAFAFVAALAGLSLVHVLLPVIEKLFRVTTSQTLLEWADTSKPLMQSLIQKAPGTWQHSHLLGSVAEAAAEEIGANGLLVRVGALYHDIGKTCKSNYFVENQEAKMNAHTGLAPTMSLLVILSHVKDGLALAREHRLPPVLHRFIAEHHGTTVVRYFHHLASKEAKATGSAREVSDSEFRYPGPKPRSRETAILMLCDSAEGAIRTLQEPTPGRIESVVHEIMMARLMDGQFDDCDITLKQLARIEQSIVKSMRAIYHGRIAYPSTAHEEKEVQARTA
jgi:putative nucleotidyltransferase with HDIG domain